MNDVFDHIPSDKRWLAQHAIKNFGKHKNLNVFCKDPFDGCSIDRFGNVFVCTCDGKLPVSVGHITDFETLEQIWNNSVAQSLQETIMNGSFCYCDVNACGILHNDSGDREQYFKYSRRKEIFLNIDESCNLQCPSCRDRLIYIKSGSEYNNKKIWADHFHGLIKHYSKGLDLYTSGNGDPFASEIYQEFLKTCKLKSNQKFNFLTNGLLLKQRMSDNPYLIENTNTIMISIDAGSKAVYENVRRPGKWSRLIENLDYLHQLSQEHSVNAQLNFVIQRANYQDIPNFIQLAKHYNFRTHYALLEDWRTFGGSFYQNNAIHLPEHPEHAAWLEIYNHYQTEINLAR
jgi:pyruvate-formate lyase-activating enzyme